MQRACSVLLLAAVAALSACRTPPPPNPALEAARQAVQQAAANPYVASGANIELSQARTALTRADQAWNDRRDQPETAHLSHLARQRALVASNVGLQHEAEARLAQAGRERERLRADAARGGVVVAAAPPVAAAPAVVAPRVATPAPTPQAAPQQILPQVATQQISPQVATQQIAPQVATQQIAPQAPPPIAPQRPQISPPGTQPIPSQQQAAAARPTEADLEAQMQLETARRRADAARNDAANTQQRQQQVAQQRERNQALQQQVEQMQGRNTQRGMTLTLPDVLFEIGGARLKPGSERTLDQLVAVMRRFPERRVLLEGFTDDVGPETVNYDLSQQRAEAFRNALLARGADGRRIDISAQGESFPVARNDTALGRAQNRRVEVIFSDESGRFAPR